MSESLKAQRERVANEIAERGACSSLGLQVDLRELQRQAFILGRAHARGGTRSMDELLDADE